MKFIVIVSKYIPDLEESLVQDSFVTSEDRKETEWLRLLELNPNWYTVDILEYKEK